MFAPLGVKCWLSALLAAVVGAVVGAVLSVALGGSEPEGVAGAPERALIERFYEESWNNGDIGLIDELFTTDYVLHMQDGRTIGRDGFKIEIPELRSSFPDLSITAGRVDHGAGQDHCAGDVARDAHGAGPGDSAEREYV